MTIAESDDGSKRRKYSNILKGTVPEY